MRDSGGEGTKGVPDGWTALGEAGLVAVAFRVGRRDIAFFKYLFESYEDVAIVRTVETLDAASAVIAVLAVPDQVEDAEEILAEVERSGTPALARVELPPVCREDWFLEEWVREDDGE